MEILKSLEALRTPFFDAVMSVVTYLGEQTVFMIAVLIVLWCINKRWGFRIFLAGLTANAANQLLKAVFLVPRPWVRDPSFTIVESAREAATGYSFPSGHSTSAASLFTLLACFFKKPAARILCVLAILLTCFSRLYLGVHTPADVAVGALTGVIVALVMYALFRASEKRPFLIYIAGAVGVLACAAAAAYVLFAPETAQNVAEFDAHGVKNTMTLLGSVIGLCAAWFADRKWLHFETQAAWWAQIIKCAVGLGLIVLIRMVLKDPLNAVFGEGVGDGVRYFIMTVAGGVLWPLTFRFFAKTYKEKKPPEAA